MSGYKSQTYEQAINVVEDSIYASGLVQKKYHYYIQFKVLEKIHTKLIKEQGSLSEAERDKSMMEKDIKINLLNQ